MLLICKMTKIGPTCTTRNAFDVTLVLRKEKGNSLSTIIKVMNDVREKFWRQSY